MSTRQNDETQICMEIPARCSNEPEVEWCKVEKILKGSLDLIFSPSVKIQIIGGKACLRYES